MKRIVYGYPGRDLEAAAARGEYVLGGCCIQGDGRDPEWACLPCQVEYTPAKLDQVRPRGNRSGTTPRKGRSS